MSEAECVVKIMMDVELNDGESNAKFFPSKAHPGDAGFDIFAAIDNDLVLRKGERALIPTGFRMALPEGWEAQIRSCSGNALKKGIFVLNSPGTIDAGYRGEVGVILFNTYDVAVTIRRGDKIAQMVIQRIPTVSLQLAHSLDDTDRGEGGFGSTGVVDKEVKNEQR